MANMMKRCTRFLDTAVDDIRRGFWAGLDWLGRIGL